jgi:rod shape-determining protein MreC
METLLSRYRNVLVFLGVMLLQFIALAVEVRTPSLNGDDGPGERLLRHWIVAVVSPPERAVVSTGSETRGLWGSYIDLRHVRAENRELRDEVNQLRLEQAQLLEDARQGQRLQALLGFREHYISQTVPAQVIGTAGSEEARVIYIDKGSQDGVEADQPVITPDGIVGKVKEVFPHTSQVLEINDQTSGAGVLLAKTRLRGVLRGNVYGQPQIINILPDERVQPGEPVITSGGDQIFPRGLPVGTVQKVVADPERDPYVDVVIRPAANLSHLEEVLVITGTGASISAKEQRDLARSQAAGAAEEEKDRAADILAEKLPGLTDLDPSAAEQSDSGEQKASGGDEVGRPMQPPQPMHADRFSPNAAPPAQQMTPGKALMSTPTGATAKAAPVSAKSVTSSKGHPSSASASSAHVAPAPLPSVASSNPASVESVRGVDLAERTSIRSVAAGNPQIHVASVAAMESAGTPHAEAGRALAKTALAASAPKSSAAASSRKPKSTYVEPKWVGKRNLPQEQPQ